MKKQSSTLFTIHTRANGALARRVNDLQAIPHGFSWAGFLFGPFWLFSQRLWLYGACASIFFAAIDAAMILGAITPLAGILTTSAAGLFIGLEGEEWRRRRAARIGLDFYDVRLARDEQEALAGALREIAAARGPWDQLGAA